MEFDVQGIPISEEDQTLNLPRRILVKPHALHLNINDSSQELPDFFHSDVRRFKSLSQESDGTVSTSLLLANWIVDRDRITLASGELANTFVADSVSEFADLAQVPGGESFLRRYGYKLRDFVTSAQLVLYHLDESFFFQFGEDAGPTLSGCYLLRLFSENRRASELVLFHPEKRLTRNVDPRFL